MNWRSIEKKPIKLKAEKISKRLCYVLRYGAKKEGLHVYTGGYVDIQEVLKIKMMSQYSVEDIMTEAAISVSPRGTSRFETRTLNGKAQIRALYGQSMEVNPYHQGCKMPTLLSLCVGKVADNILMYNLDEFPDMYLHGMIFRRLKREKKLNQGPLQTVLTPSMERLNLVNVFLTEKSFDIICTRGVNLQVLNLRGSGYVLNDHILEKTLMKLKKLESLNISGCVHLTDRSLKAIIKYSPGLIHLNAAAVWKLTEGGILDLIIKCTKLEHLDIYDNWNIGKETRNTIIDIANERKLKVVLKGLTDERVALKDPSQILPIWLDMAG